MRQARTTEARSYALFFKSDAIPKSLAESSAREAKSGKTSTPPYPAWETPYLSKQGKATAEVVVVWKGDSRFPNHSAATVFSMEHYKNRWVVVDAREVKDVSKIPAPLGR